ncbi:MAG: FadR/GntR family transcriptional regulator [Pseudomonadota bacterium]
MNKLKPVVVASATMQIAEQIRAAILDGTFKSGEQLPTEMDMSVQFGVSRPTIREALKRLAAQNLITSRRGPTGGTFVRHYEVSDAAESVVTATMLMLSLESVKYSEILDVRRFMQFHCCQKLIRKWSPEIGDRIDRALRDLERPNLSDEDFCDYDVNFHRTIVDATENPMLQYLMYGVIESLMPVMSVNIAYVQDRSVIVDQYRALRDALFAADETAAKEAIDQLISYLRDLSETVEAQRTKSA